MDIVRQYIAKPNNLQSRRLFKVFDAPRRFQLESKEKRIQVLIKHFTTAGFTVFRSSIDAYVLFVKKATENATDCPVVLSADDNDILLLLVYHWDKTLKSVHFSSEGLDAESKKGMYRNI